MNCEAHNGDCGARATLIVMTGPDDTYRFACASCGRRYEDRWSLSARRVTDLFRQRLALRHDESRGARRLLWECIWWLRDDAARRAA